MSRNLIYLFGMPGSGKTTLGKQLARELGMSFVDLDERIEARETRKISEIFAREGEDYFRKVEQKVVSDSASLENSVISTGGGAPCFFDNLQIMNEAGLTIFIDVSPSELVERTFSKSQDRPLLVGKDRDQLLEETEQRIAARREFYDQAKVSLKSDKLMAQDLINVIHHFQ